LVEFFARRSRLVSAASGAPPPITAIFHAEEKILMQAAGTIDPDGAFRFGVSTYTEKFSFRGEYSGTLNDTGGTLAGTQVLSRQTTGDGRTRTCKGTFLKVELPRR
jgi:hypothetical protein